MNYSEILAQQLGCNKNEIADKLFPMNRNYSEYERVEYMQAIYAAMAMVNPIIPNPTLQFPEECHVVNGKNFWLDESLPKEKKETILQFIKAVTHKKLSGGKPEG